MSGVQSHHAAVARKRADSTPPPPENIAYLDTVSGDDELAELGNPSQPFLTVEAIISAFEALSLTTGTIENQLAASTVVFTVSGITSIERLIFTGEAYDYVTLYQDQDIAFTFEWNTNVTTALSHKTTAASILRTATVTYEGTGVINYGDFAGIAGAAGAPGIDDHQNGADGDVGSGYTGYNGGTAVGGTGNAGEAGGSVSPFHFAGMLTIVNIDASGASGGDAGAGGSALANGGMGTDDGFGSPAAGGNGGTATGGNGGPTSNGGNGGVFTRTSSFSFTSFVANGGFAGAYGPGGGASASGGGDFNSGGIGLDGTATPGNDGAMIGVAGTAGSLTLI